MQFIKSFFIGLLVLGIMSCEKAYFFNQGVEIPNQQWVVSDSVSFDVTITDTTKIYDLILSVDHSMEYPHQNLYMMIYTKFPTGERLKQQLSIDFADKLGKWYGDCSSESCSLDFNLQQGAFFNTAGQYEFTFKQHMRRDSIQGINGIKFKIEDTGKQR